MSKWSSLLDPNDVFGGDGPVVEEEGLACGYIVRISPPTSGPSRPSSAVDIASITIPHITEGFDTSRKTVAWYEVVVRTSTHEWAVLKRFSEFHELRVAVERLGLMRIARQLLHTSVALPPSRLRLASSTALARERREKLMGFLDSLLRSLKDLTVLIVAAPETHGEGSETVVVARAAFSTLLHFLTSASCEEAVPSNAAAAQRRCSKGLWCAPTPNANGGMETSWRSLLAIDASRALVPPVRIVHLPLRRFCILLLLPGVVLSTVYVDTGVRPEVPREIVVGGSWNDGITSVAALLAETVETPSASAESAMSGRTATLGTHDHILIDTFPQGDFQMRFEVPPPFEIGAWQSDYISGVLFLTWNSNNAGAEGAPLDSSR